MFDGARYAVAAALTALLASTACGEASGPPPECIVGCGPDDGTHCPSGTVRADDGSCMSPGVRACAAGFERDGPGCRVIAASTCGPNTRAAIGRTDCVQVGTSSCTEGFTATDFGCDATSPSEPCTGATYAAWGAPSCVAFEGCNAAFPPVDTDIFVDDDFADNELDATHFRTITEAVTAASPNDTIAIDSGVYNEAVLVRKSLRLVGRCAGLTTIRGTGAAAAGLWIRNGAGVIVERLSLTRHDIGLEVDTRARATVRDVLIDDNQWVGVLALSDVTLERSAIRGTRARPNGTSGRGIAVQSGARAELRDVAIEANREYGIYVSGAGTVAEMIGGRIDRTTVNPAGAGGTGVHVQNGARFALENVSIKDNAVAGLRASGEGAVIEASQVVVRGHEHGGVVSRNGATVRVRRSLITDNLRAGLTAIAAQLEVTDSVVTRTRVWTGDPAVFAVSVFEGGAAQVENSAIVDNDGFGFYAERAAGVMRSSLVANVDGDLAPGVGAHDGASVSVEGSAIVDAGGAGILVGTDGGRIDVVDSIVEGTRPHGGPQIGAGVVTNTGTITLTRCALRHNASTGASVGSLNELGGTLVLESSTIEGSVGRDGLGDDAQEGFGAWVNLGATATIDDCDFKRNEFAALGVGGTAVVTHSVFRETASNRAGDYGEGIFAAGAVTVTGSAIIANKTIAVQATGEDAHVTLHRSLIDATAAKIDGLFGHGAAVSGNGQMFIEGSEIRSSQGVGLVVAEGAAVAMDTLFSANTIGVHAQRGTTLVTGATPELRRGSLFIADDSRFVDNGSKVGAGEVPIPKAIENPL